MKVPRKQAAGILARGLAGFAAAWGLTTNAVAAEGVRTWTAKSGKKIEATLVRDSSYVVLTTPYGEQIRILREELSDADRAYLDILKQKPDVVKSYYLPGISLAYLPTVGVRLPRDLDLEGRRGEAFSAWVGAWTVRVASDPALQRDMDKLLEALDAPDQGVAALRTQMNFIEQRETGLDNLKKEQQPALARWVAAYTRLVLSAMKTRQGQIDLPALHQAIQAVGPAITQSDKLEPEWEREIRRLAPEYEDRYERMTYGNYRRLKDATKWLVTRPDPKLGHRAVVTVGRKILLDPHKVERQALEQKLYTLRRERATQQFARLMDQLRLLQLSAPP